MHKPDQDLAESQKVVIETDLASKHTIFIRYLFLSLQKLYL